MALSSVAVIGLGAPSAFAGSQVTTNACLSNATATYSDLNWTLTGTGTPNPATLGAGNVTLGTSSVVVDIPATLLIAGYNLGLLTLGANNIPVNVWVARKATNVSSPAGGIQKDTFATTVVTTITDPDGTPGTGDEAATPLHVDQPLPDMIVTPSGGNVAFAQAGPGTLGQLPVGVGGALQTVNGSIFAQAVVAGGLIKANFDCQPGTTIIDPPGGTSGTTFTPATALPFETVTVVAPPTAPVCSNETSSVGVGQSVTIDLTDNCTDVNGDPLTITTTAASAGTLSPTATPGVFTYTAPLSDPGAPVTASFTATDPGGLSGGGTITITILANTCDATTSPCSLTEIVVQPVIGTTMTMTKVAGQVIMSPIILNGQPQVSNGALQQLTVINARGTAAGWTLAGFVTDLGAPGTPTTVVNGQTIPTCSLAGGGGSANRLCIPGDNMGWSPAAAIAHAVIPGDVAQVAPGTATAADAATWLTNLTTAGANHNGIGGLGEANVLCSSPTDHSGGTFTCNAALYLGVPASAAAGNFAGGLVLTLA